MDIVYQIKIPQLLTSAIINDCLLDCIAETTLADETVLTFNTAGDMFKFFNCVGDPDLGIESFDLYDYDQEIIHDIKNNDDGNDQLIVFYDYGGK